MKIGFFSSITALLAGTSLALAQPPFAPAPATSGPVGGPLPAAGAPGLAPDSYPIVPSAPMGPEAVTGSGGHCGHCGPVDWLSQCPLRNPPRVWATGEYLLWRLSSSALPPTAVVSLSQPVNLTSVTPIVTVTTPNGFLPLTSLASQGTLTATAGQPLFPIGSAFDERDLTGMRWTAGFVLDPAGDYFLEASYFQLFPHTEASGVNPAVPVPLQGSVNIPVVPFFNTNLGTTTVFPGPPVSVVSTAPIVNSVPATLSGNVIVNGHINQESKLWGAEINFGGKTCSLFADRVDLLVGFRYLDLNEVMTLDTNTNIALNPGPAVNSAGFQVTGLQFSNPINGVAQAVILPPLFGLTTHDLIKTQNQFYGAQIGIKGEWDLGRLFFQGFGKVAVGTMHQVVDIAGSQILNGTTFNGGLLSTPDNLGHHSRNRMGLIPEGYISAGLYVFPWMKAFVGYDFLWIDKVVRPGDQVSFGSINSSISLQANGLNLNTPVSSRPPGLNIQESAIWVQGLTFGIELQF